ncbi:hypothetical protein lerEdw1_006891 [Lerista edwardsae]|nr:hypothetical protein lerEdw1_006891 [Lerista edwardsae]
MSLVRRRHGVIAPWEAVVGGVSHEQPLDRKRRWQPGGSGPAADPECTVEVKLELGHHAQLREKPTSEGFTHDWMVFVRGPEQFEVQHFVEKVVFRLYQYSPNPKRVCKEPPYKVEESGNAGFIMPIEIYLRNKGELKRACFTYDLSLNQEGNPPVITCAVRD